MMKKNFLLSVGIIIFIATIITSISLYFQRNLTTLNVLIIIGSALLGSVAIINGVKETIDLVKQFSDHEEGKTSKNYADFKKGITAFLITSPLHGKAFPVGSIIEARGKHSLNQNSFVWAITTDTYGNYYLQNPPTVLDSDKRWRSTNIHLGRDIIEIIFVKVTHDGNDIFLKKVVDKDWGAFSNLPLRTVILGRVRVGLS